MTTLKLNGEEIKVVEGTICKNEGGVVLTFKAEDFYGFDGMRIKGYFEATIDGTSFDFEGVGAIYREEDGVSITVRYM